MATTCVLEAQLVIKLTPGDSWDLGWMVVVVCSWMFDLYTTDLGCMNYECM